MPVTKSSGSSWRRDYALHLAVGAVLSLALVLSAAHLSVYRSAPDTKQPPPPEIVELEELAPPTRDATPPAPPSPLPPEVVPNDEIIASETPISFEPGLPIDPNITTEAPPKPPEEEAGEPTVFVAVEIMPRPKGGMKALYENLEYPDRARRAGVDGRVMVRFTVMPDGSVRNVVVQKSANSLLNEAAVRAVKETEFLPGKQRTTPVAVRMTVPITFRLK